MLEEDKSPLENILHSLEDYNSNLEKLKKMELSYELFFASKMVYRECLARL
jgi:hypothetical protein